MAKQVIGIGNIANDGSGDPLRTAFDKANDNFTELYDADSLQQTSIDAFDNSYRCQINVAITTGSNDIDFTSPFVDANYRLQIDDPLGIVASLDSNNADGFTITATGNGTITYIANYIK